MQQPLVSILMPVHNAAPYLRASIESVSAQSYANWELIVVDDHSDDTSLSVAQEFTSEPRITVLAGSNHGASACRNQAFLASKGDFVKFLDADDILSETHIEQQVPAVIENPMQVACSAWTRFEHAIPDRAILTPDSSWRTLEPLDW
ncbi:MAG: glycosyltransferase family 2 protein, partial [Bdellovibrionales bacterium]|nr:glycosyltransferase family 2 protein [Bdellovibrionales bacterium]